MGETDQIEFEHLQRRAFDMGFHVERHRAYDPCRSGGDLYLQPRKKFRNEQAVTILRYATVDEIWTWLNKNNGGSYEQGIR